MKLRTGVDKFTMGCYCYVSGETLMLIHHDEPELPEEYISLLTEAVVIKNTPCTRPKSRVLDVLT